MTQNLLTSSLLWLINLINLLLQNKVIINLYFDLQKPHGYWWLSLSLKLSHGWASWSPHPTTSTNGRLAQQHHHNRWLPPPLYFTLFSLFFSIIFSFCLWPNPFLCLVLWLVFGLVDFVIGFSVDWNDLNDLDLGL